MKIPVLKIIDLDYYFESYLTLEDKIEKRVITDDQYAYKIYPFNYFLVDDKFQWNLLMTFMLFNKKNLKIAGIQQLDAILLGKNYLAFRLPLLELIYREFLSYNRCHQQICWIVQQIVEGIEELHMNGYVHRDLKPQNIMMDFKPLRVYIIDFKRTHRVEASALENVRGTLGYFPERDGDKQRIKQYLDKNKINGGLRELACSTIIKPSYENEFTLDTIKIQLRKIKFRELPQNSKLMIV